MSSTRRADRPFDLVLWGATGFTGQLVAQYLHSHRRADSFRWAIAGRNRDKLLGLRQELGATADELPILVGDSLDAQSLEDMAAQTRVVCSTVGPYARYGSPLVAACIEQGSDYCDLTGEVHWVREMIDEHHHAAREAQVRIVHCCGFDSIPSDLGTAYLQSLAMERFGEPFSEIRMLVWKVKGGISGGTAASMADLVEKAARDKAIRRILADPYSLAPKGQRSGPDSSSQHTPRREGDIGTWSAPFIMAAVNEKIVRRSNALLDYPYGSDFQYREATRVGPGLPGALRAGLMSAGIGAFSAAMALSPTRSLLKRFLLPDPGEGPDKEAIDAGYFTLRFVGTHRSSSSSPLMVDVSADADPGYGATSMMLGESALSLALDDPSDQAPHLHRGGVLTPASALGSMLIERLQQAGMSFQLVDESVL